MKIEIADSDIQFLRALKTEMLTQPTDGNCHPRFWGIREKVRTYGFESEYADGWVIFDGENVSEVGKPDDLQSIIDELTDPDGYEYAPEDFENCADPEDICEKVHDLRGDRSYPLSVVRYKDDYITRKDALFLTKKACQEHIKRYGYNYKDPHTYVMTADRCPEYERLLDILVQTKWEAVAEKGCTFGEGVTVKPGTFEEE